MNKSQLSPQSNSRFRQIHNGATAVIFSFVIGQSFGFSGINSAEADPVTTEPVIKVVEPYASSAAESSNAATQDVIDVLQTMGKAYASGNIAEYIKHLADQCSVFDEHKNKMIHGKEAVIAALKEKFATHSLTGSEQIISYTIIQPYVKVNGNTAVVSYRAIEEVGGSNPRKLQGAMTDVFEKQDGHWMKVHQSAVWKRLK